MLQSSATATRPEAFLLQYGHGVGLSLWKRPIISKRYTGRNTPLGAWCSRSKSGRGAEDGCGAAHIEEESRGD